MDAELVKLRERYKREGLSGFSDNEALSLLLSYALPDDGGAVADKLIHSYDSLYSVCRGELADLEQLPGMNLNAAVELKLLFELCPFLMRAPLEDGRKRCIVRTAEDACRLAACISWGERYETLRIISLDSEYTMLSCDRVSEGGISMVELDMRKIFTRALQHNASKFILVHNHPSGIPLPSDADAHAYRAARELAKALSFELIDSIITCGFSAYSFVSENVCMYTHAGSISQSAQDFKARNKL